MAKLSMVNRVAGRAVARQLGLARYADPALGFALLRDARVPARYKALAMGLGLAIMTGLVFVEAPVEAMIAFLVPMLGPMADMLADGAEETLGTVLVATLLLPHLAPRATVDEIRRERES